MILTKTVDIILSNKNITYYKNLLNNNLKSGQLITIDTTFLLKGSHYKIDTQCDICNNIRKMEYRTYIKLTNNLTLQYYCNKCKVIKTKETSLLKYGTVCPSQNSSVKEKIFKTNLSKFGSLYPSQNNEIKNKIMETNLNKFGTTSYLNLLNNKHDKNHKKSKETINKKYSDIFLKKTKEIHGDLYEYKSSYINMNTKLIILCKKCKCTFTQKPKDHIHNKQGCPHCNQSKGSSTVQNNLEKY